MSLNLRYPHSLGRLLSIGRVGNALTIRRLVAQRRAGSLEQKLEALKSIEQRIIQRGAPETGR